jgi:hypothetical protein
MGHEFLGGTFRRIAQSSKRPTYVRVYEHPGRGETPGVLELRMHQTLSDRRLTRSLFLRNDCPIIRGRISGSAPRETTITCRFSSTLAAKQIEMDVPGGLLSRPLHKLYDPTFWPARRLCLLTGRRSR